MYFLNNFLVSHAAVLIVVLLLYFTSLILIHLITGTLYLLTTSILPSPTLGNHKSDVFFYKFAVCLLIIFIRFHIKVRSYLFLIQVLNRPFLQSFCDLQIKIGLCLLSEQEIICMCDKHNVVEYSLLFVDSQQFLILYYVLIFQVYYKFIVFCDIFNISSVIKFYNFRFPFSLFHDSQKIYLILLRIIYIICKLEKAWLF